MIWKRSVREMTRTLAKTVFSNICSLLSRPLIFEHTILDTRISGYPPWNLKRAGLESSGGIVSSLYWKTKVIAFFQAEKENKNKIKTDFLDFFGFFQIIRFFDHFWQFLDFFFLSFWILFKIIKVTAKSYQGYYWSQKMA